MKIAFIITMVVAGAALADDITTTDGTKYQNVTISRVEPDGIQIETDSGIVKIPFTSLPKDLQAKYGYDPKKAAAYAAQDAAAQHRLYEKNEQELNAKTAADNAEIANERKKDEDAKSAALEVVKIYKVVEGGVLVMTERAGQTGGEVASGMIFIEGMDGSSEDEEYQVQISRDGIYKNGTSTLQKWKCLSSTKNITLMPSDAPTAPVSSLQSVGGG